MPSSGFRTLVVQAFRPAGLDAAIARYCEATRNVGRGRRRTGISLRAPSIGGPEKRRSDSVLLRSRGGQGCYDIRGSASDAVPWNLEEWDWQIVQTGSQISGTVAPVWSFPAAHQPGTFGVLSGTFSGR